MENVNVIESAIGTPLSDDGSLVLSSQCSIPSVRSLQRQSPVCLAGYETFSASTARILGGAVHSLAISASSLLAGTASAMLFCFQNPGDLTESESLTSSSDEGVVKIRIWEMTRRLRRVASLPTASDRAFQFLLSQNHVLVRRHRNSLWIDHVDAVSALVARNSLLYSVSWDRTLSACPTSTASNQYDGQRKHSLVPTLEGHRSTVNALQWLRKLNSLDKNKCRTE